MGRTFFVRGQLMHWSASRGHVVVDNAPSVALATSRQRRDEAAYRDALFAERLAQIEYSQWQERAPFRRPGALRPSASEEARAEARRRETAWRAREAKEDAEWTAKIRAAEAAASSRYEPLHRSLGTRPKPWSHGMPLGALSAVGAVLAVPLLWRRRARTPGTCWSCGYDLRATPARCPECGREVGLISETATTDVGMEYGPSY